jgi:hypothetical protein
MAPFIESLQLFLLMVFNSIRKRSLRALERREALKSDASLESYFVEGAGIDFSNTIKTCTARFTVAVLIRMGRQPSAACVASLLSIAGAVSLMIW